MESIGMYSPHNLSSLCSFHHLRTSSSANISDHAVPAEGSSLLRSITPSEYAEFGSLATEYGSDNTTPTLSRDGEGGFDDLLLAQEWAQAISASFSHHTPHNHQPGSGPTSASLMWRHQDNCYYFDQPWPNRSSGYLGQQSLQFQQPSTSELIYSTTTFMHSDLGLSTPHIHTHRGATMAYPALSVYDRPHPSTFSQGSMTQDSASAEHNNRVHKMSNECCSRPLVALQELPMLLTASAATQTAAVPFCANVLIKIKPNLAVPLSELVELGLVPPLPSAVTKPAYPAHLPFVRCCYDANEKKGCGKGSNCYHVHSNAADRSRPPGLKWQVYIDRPHFSAFNETGTGIDLQTLPCNYGMGCMDPQHRRCAFKHKFNAAALAEYDSYLRAFRTYEFALIEHHHAVNRARKDLTEKAILEAQERKVRATMPW